MRRGWRSVNPCFTCMDNELPVAIRTVPIVLMSDGQGSVGRAEPGEHVLQGFEALRRELESIFNDRSLSFDRASSPDRSDLEVLRDRSVGRRVRELERHKSGIQPGADNGRELTLRRARSAGMGTRARDFNRQTQWEMPRDEWCRRIRRWPGHDRQARTRASERRRA